MTHLHVIRSAPSGAAALVAVATVATVAALAVAAPSPAVASPVASPVAPPFAGPLAATNPARAAGDSSPHAIANPSDPTAPVPPLPAIRAFDGYHAYAPPDLSPWRASNAAVGPGNAQAATNLAPPAVPPATSAPNREAGQGTDRGTKPGHHGHHGHHSY